MCASIYRRIDNGHRIRCIRVSNAKQEGPGRAAAGKGPIQRRGDEEDEEDEDEDEEKEEEEDG